MDKNTQKNLVIALIKDDMISSKLVSGLNQIGLDAIHYHLHLSDSPISRIKVIDKTKVEQR